MKLSVRIGVPVALVFLAAAGAASWLLGSRLADTGARVERLSKELAERGQKEAELSQRLAVVSSGRDAAGLAAKAAERLAGYIAEKKEQLGAPALTAKPRQTAPASVPSPAPLAVERTNFALERSKRERPAGTNSSIFDSFQRLTHSPRVSPPITC